MKNESHANGRASQREYERPAEHFRFRFLHRETKDSEISFHFGVLSSSLSWSWSWSWPSSSVFFVFVVLLDVRRMSTVVDEGNVNMQKPHSNSISSVRCVCVCARALGIRTFHSKPIKVDKMNLTNGTFLSHSTRFDSIHGRQRTILWPHRSRTHDKRKYVGFEIRMFGFHAFGQCRCLAQN